MATKKYDSFKDLRKGKYDWKVEARVLNLWRGYTKKKEPFKWFNLLLVDSKRSRVHAFVPAAIADVIEPAIEIGKAYLFKNFTVKDYKEEDKFRCILRDIQIVFSTETKITELEDKDVCIEHTVFDFYDLGDLKQLSKQTTYLTDVVGVIKDANITLAKFKNRLQQSQTQMKFQITDGIHQANVTFWDAFAEEFNEVLKGEFEYPLIIIIGCGRVSEWQGQVDVSNVGATTFHLNSSHHSVSHMRHMLQEPQFENFRISNMQDDTPPVLMVKQIKELDKDYEKKEIFCELIVKFVHGGTKWFKNICSSCYNETTIEEDINKCTCGPRDVPYPMKWFYVSITCEDETGEIHLILNNIAGQKCYRSDVYDILEKEEKDYLQMLKVIEKNKFFMKILIQEDNISGKSNTYLATDALENLVTEIQKNPLDYSQPKPLEESYAEGSTSNYHIESMSENN